MPPPPDSLPPAGASALPLSGHQARSLAERIGTLHQQVRMVAPVVDRLSLALYDPGTDELSTFVDSGAVGQPLRAYQHRLADTPGLAALAATRQARVITDLAAAFGDPAGQGAHSRWLLAQGFRSSYTVPLFDEDTFEGFLFFDARVPDAFGPAVVERLEVYGRLAALMIGHELAAVRALVGTVRVARDFAHLRDVETGAHLDRMARYTRLIARVVAPARGQGDEFIQQLFLFAPLHDIGKIGVPDAVLLKPGRFDAAERALMQTHVRLGSEIIERLVGEFQLGTLAGVDILRQLVACHHEYLDGSGYPQGRRGADVPLAARIVTVADIFDALTSARPYKPAWPREQALVHLDGMVAAGQLDADCVAALRGGLDEVADIAQRFPD